MNEPKRHHYVPQFYLRRFAVNDKLQLVHRDDLASSFSCSVGRAFAENYFYSQSAPDGGRDNSIERLFSSHLEGPASRALERVVDLGKPPVRGLRERLALLIAFQFVRGQAVRRAVVEAERAIWAKAASHVALAIAREPDEDGRILSEDEVASFVSRASDPANWRFARHEGEEGDSPEQMGTLHLQRVVPIARDVAMGLIDRHWRILDFGAPVLVTGDEPVGLVGRSGEPGELLGIGNASKVVYPTDPKHALVLALASRGGSGGWCRSRGTQDMADVINRHVAYGCHRFIAHRPGTAPLRSTTLPKQGAQLTVDGDIVEFRPRPPALEG